MFLISFIIYGIYCRLLSALYTHRYSKYAFTDSYLPGGVKSTVWNKENALWFQTGASRIHFSTTLCYSVSPSRYRSWFIWKPFDDCKRATMLVIVQLILAETLEHSVCVYGASDIWEHAFRMLEWEKFNIRKVLDTKRSSGIWQWTSSVVKCQK